MMLRACEESNRFLWKEKEVMFVSLVKVPACYSNHSGDRAKGEGRRIFMYLRSDKTVEYFPIF